MADAVMVTGASGFVGCAVLRGLQARGIPVHAVSRREAQSGDGVTWHRADLLTAEGRAAVAGLAPRMIHCAWDVEHGAFWTSPANPLWHAASVDLARGFRAAGGQRIVALGTCAEYEANSGGPWNESRPVAPATPYGQAKAALFRDLTGLCEGDLIWARLFHLYGPGEDPRRFVASLIAKLGNGQRAMVNAPNLVRDYATTAHIATCLIDLLESAASGAFDIGSGNAVKLGQLADWIAEAMGARHLLDRGEGAGMNDIAFMAPELGRLSAAIHFVPEHPRDAVGQIVWGMNPEKGHSPRL